MDIITLIQVLVSGLLNAQEEFLEHLDQFSTFEETVNRLTDQVAADFIGLTLTNFADTLIRESGKRKAWLYCTEKQKPDSDLRSRRYYIHPYSI